MTDLIEGQLGCFSLFKLERFYAESVRRLAITSRPPGAKRETSRLPRTVVSFSDVKFAQVTTLVLLWLRLLLHLTISTTARTGTA